MKAGGPLEGWRRWLDPRYAWARGTHNLGLKLLALGVSVTLWFVATGDRRANVEQGFDVPVTVNFPELVMASALLMKGPKYLETVLTDLEKWMEDFGYESITQMKGSLSHKNTAEPAAFERANYLKLLQSFKLPHYPSASRASWSSSA